MCRLQQQISRLGTQVLSWQSGLVPKNHSWQCANHQANGIKGIDHSLAAVWCDSYCDVRRRTCLDSPDLFLKTHQTTLSIARHPRSSNNVHFLGRLIQVDRPNWHNSSSFSCSCPFGYVF